VILLFYFSLIPYFFICTWIPVSGAYSETKEVLTSGRMCSGWVMPGDDLFCMSLSDRQLRLCVKEHERHGRDGFIKLNTLHREVLKLFHPGDINNDIENTTWKIWFQLLIKFTLRIGLWLFYDCSLTLWTPPTVDRVEFTRQLSLLIYIHNITSNKVNDLVRSTHNYSWTSLLFSPQSLTALHYKWPIC